MDTNNLNINDFNNMQQPSISTEHPNISGQTEQTKQTTLEEAQYGYLKELNKKLTLFKSHTEQSGKWDKKN